MKVLVDTSLWLDHFHDNDSSLINLLHEGAVFSHAFIIGELACGNIKNRDEILSHLQSLPQARLSDPFEILFFINIHKLYGQGLGLVDINLLMSCLLDSLQLFTRDKRLKKAAQKLNIAYEV